MKILAIALAAAFLVAFLFVMPEIYSQAQTQNDSTNNNSNSDINTGLPIPGSYIIELKDTIPEGFVADKAQEINVMLHNETPNGEVTHVYEHAIKGFAVSDITSEALNALAIDPDIKSIEPNVMDELHAQYLPSALNRIDLEKMLGAAASCCKPNNRENKVDVDVAVVDEPTVQSHPDLNIYRRVNFLDGCGSGGYECNIEGGTHGTHVAGSIAARDNLGGVVGSVPGARIWSLAICYTDIPANAQGSCPFSATLAAWDYIANHPEIEAGNMSVGGGGTVSSAVQDAGQAIIDSGATFFVSAGNSHSNVNNLHYCGVDAFICVSALSDYDGLCGGKYGGPYYASGNFGTSYDDRRASFSSYGSDVDIMSPGVDVLSTYPGYVNPTIVRSMNNIPYIGHSPPRNIGGGAIESGQGVYGLSSGTSMASPIAAGVGAMLMAVNPSWTPAQVKSSLQNNAYSQTLSCDGASKGGLMPTQGNSGGPNFGSSEKILYAGNY